MLENWWEKITRYLAYHIPARIVYFCVIRVWAFGTSGVYSHEDAIRAEVDVVLRRWQSGKIVRHNVECDALCEAQGNHQGR